MEESCEKEDFNISLSSDGSPMKAHQNLQVNQRADRLSDCDIDLSDMELSNADDKIAERFFKGRRSSGTSDAGVESPELSAQAINISQVNERNLDLRNTPLKNVWPEPEQIIKSSRVVLKKPQIIFTKEDTTTP